MHEPLKYHHVNWVDGMKINKNQFIALENASKDLIRDGISVWLNEHNYGLLPAFPGTGDSLNVVLTVDNQKTLRVRLFQCRAITPGGSRIEVLGNSSQLHGFAVPIPEATFEIVAGETALTLFVVLSVNIFGRVPVGNADPAEEPPRYPSIIPQYKVHLVPEDQVSSNEMGSGFLFIGKVRITDGTPILVEEYIPPCVSVRSFPALMKAHAEFDKSLSQLEIDLLKILKKINEKEQTNVLARTVAHLSENMLYFVSTVILDFRWKVIDQPPLGMIEVIARLARLIKNTIDSNAGEAKEEMLNYFTDWCNLKQGEFEKYLHATVNFNYLHTDIYSSLLQMMQFQEVISTLFSKLSVLEYIGKKKETNIFVKEQTTPQPPSSKKSFLAD
jgi:hypothetical protein